VMAEAWPAKIRAASAAEHPRRRFMDRSILAGKKEEPADAARRRP